MIGFIFSIIMIAICLHWYTQSHRRIRLNERRTKLLTVFLNMETYEFSYTQSKQIEEILVKGNRATDGDYRRINNVIEVQKDKLNSIFTSKRKRNCKYYASSVHLLCAVNPVVTTCEGCQHFEEKATN